MKKMFNYDKFVSKMNESFNSSDSRLLKKIDYTLLKPEATEDDIIQLCKKADTLGVKSVCVLPKMVKIAAEELSHSDVLVCTVISFPHGTDSTEQKVSECRKAIADGADECDMVLDYPKLKESEESYDDLVNDVSALVDECHSDRNKDGEKITLKVIVESGLLNDRQTDIATHICLDAGADFIKTSTGMVVGAEIGKVDRMRKIIKRSGGLDMQIKASGGLRTLADLQKFDSLVDRFGVGFAAVDSIFGEDEKSVGDGY